MKEWLPVIVADALNYSNLVKLSAEAVIDSNEPLLREIILPSILIL